MSYYGECTVTYTSAVQRVSYSEDNWNHKIFNLLDPRAKIILTGMK